MLVGLQGAGKTTSAGKLAYLHKNKLKKKVLLAGLDVYRPAAIEQLGTLARQINVDFFEMGTEVSPVEAAKKAEERAVAEGYDLLVLDTAGRLQIDEKLMGELKDINKAVHPEEVLLLVDAMAGQDAVNVTNAFNQDLHLTGVIMARTLSLGVAPLLSHFKANSSLISAFSSPIAGSKVPICSM